MKPIRKVRGFNEISQSIEHVCGIKLLSRFLRNNDAIPRENDDENLIHLNRFI